MDLKVPIGKILGDSREIHKDVTDEDKRHEIFRYPAEDHDNQRT